MAETTTVSYRLQDGNDELSIVFDGITVWLTHEQIAALYGVDDSAAKKLIANIIDEEEVDPDPSISRMEVTRQVGSRTISCLTAVFNLDMAIAVGKRLHSTEATAFRTWAHTLREKN